MSCEIPHQSQPLAISLDLPSYLSNYYFLPIVLLLNSFFSETLETDHLTYPTKTQLTESLILFNTNC